MGLKEDNGGSGGNILVVKRGAICLESSTYREGWEHVEGDVDGRAYEKWIKKFGSVDGMVTDIKWYDEQPNEVRYQGFKITIEDGDDTYLLDLPYDKPPYNAFTRFVENIDFTKPVEFAAWTDRQDGGTGFCAKQDGQVVRQKYTKAYIMSGETDCPPAIENKRTGKFNFDEQNEWLLENVLENVVPRLGKSEAKAAAEPKSKKGKAKAAAAEDRWAGVEDPIHDN